MVDRHCAILALVALTGCAATHAPSPGDAAITSLMTAGDRARLTALAAQRMTQRLESDPGYRIGPDDLLEVSIPDLLDAAAFRGVMQTAPAGPAVTSVDPAPAFREGLRVSALGDIVIPQLGVVAAGGHTVRGLENEIARRLRAAGILNQPEVTVTIVEHRSHVVAVVGSVQRPGLYPLTRPEATITELIWAAGGPSSDAGRIVQFTPATVSATSAADQPGGAVGGSGAPVVPIRIDLEVLLRSNEDGVADLDAPVRPGDVVNIAPAGSVLVDGWVQKPGAYPVTRNLTLTGTIAAAGGSSFAADRSRATLKRVVNASEEQFMTVDLHAVDDREEADLPIVDGDVVYLPASGAKLVPWSIWQLIATLFRVGASVVAF